MENIVHILHPNPDGTVAITALISTTADEWMSAYHPGKPFMKVDPNSLPHSDYQSAWTSDFKTKIGVDMERAREIKRQLLREQRAALLGDVASGTPGKLDLEAIIALGKGDTAALADIEKRKQSLRDVTKAKEIDKAKTIDDLLAFNPIEAA